MILRQEGLAPTAARNDRFQKLLDEVWRGNAFYQEKFAAAGLKRTDTRSPADLTRLPFTTKAEFLEDQKNHPPYGRNLTYALSRYVRLTQTSGTTGQPLRWLDTAESWNWMLECWNTIYHFARVTSIDRLFFPFSFGPFLGFWTAFEAGCRLSCLCLPAGGMSSVARLQMMLDNGATVVLCTPTYALRLAEVAREQGIDLHSSAVRALIVAGEPGGSIPSIRQRIEEAWNARVFDHSGLTEVGPMTIECPDHPGGLHILEDDYLVEVIDPQTGNHLPAGEVGEMVVTNLGRSGSPVIRYRTGDLVRVDPSPCPCGSGFRRLGGGILGRTDDMIHYRGNNVYPSALENVIGRFSEVAEYRIEIDRASAMPALRIEVEPASVAAGSGLAERIAQVIRDELLFRADVSVVAPGALPRFEMKGRRITHRHD